MKENGNWALRTVMVHGNLQREIRIKDSGYSIVSKVKAFIGIKIVFMRVSLCKLSNKDREDKSILMEMNILESITKESLMEKGSMSGRMETFIKANSRMA